jgi:RNA polymerase sigma-70 factor (ECF subfamily)
MIMSALRQDQFERLYAEHAQPLFAFLSYRTGDRVQAEDLLADTFERALRARRRFDPRKGSAKTWLYAIALNCVRDHARRRASEGRAIERIGSEERAGASPSLVDVWDQRSASELEAIVERDLIARVLDALADEEREAIALRFGADLTVPEIARLTGQRLTTVEGRVYRALRKLRSAMYAEDAQPNRSQESNVSHV